MNKQYKYVGIVRHRTGEIVKCAKTGRLECIETDNQLAWLSWHQEMTRKYFNDHYYIEAR